MNFHFCNLVLWLKSGCIRNIEFQPNKVNIITGKSNTGKTAILDIIDYCLFASRHKISDSKINENVEWYGIKFSINDKCYTIARKAPVGSKVSPIYYFSSIGDIPDSFPNENMTESALKKLLETEFNIDQETKIAYGGKTLKANSKISLRYFLLFNTISQDIITNSEEFFDKQKEDRYREALPRTFDLAVGIDTAENILKQEKREEIQRKIRKLEREENNLNRKRSAFHGQLSSLIQMAKEFLLIPEESSMGDSISLLKRMVSETEARIEKMVPEKYDQITSEISTFTRKIANLERFTKEYKSYKVNLKVTEDSLKPIDYLMNQHNQVIKTSIYDEILTGLQGDYNTIKKAISSKTPLDSNVKDVIKGYEKKIEELKSEKELLPRNIKEFETDKKKYMFLGEVKAKLDLYENNEDDYEDSAGHTIKKLEEDLDNLVVDSIEERRELFVKALDETIQDYISRCKGALVNYGEYRSSFNYTEKKLQLRKPKTDFIDSIGSSSNHMFLHIFLFLGIHELIAKKDIPYVPSFLIIDQFSRPYWGEDESQKDKLDATDTSKVKSVLNLLNTFMDELIQNKKEFQIIVFEHIPSALWKENNNIHLVEEFIDGNALIPNSMLKSN